LKYLKHSIFQLSVPIENILSQKGDEIEIDFQYTTPNSNDSTNTGSEDANKKQTGSNDEAQHENEPKGSDGTPSSLDNVTQMLDGDLFDLFKSSYRKNHAFQITREKQPTIRISLKSKPIASSLWKMGCFPGVSRIAVKEDPWMRDEHTHMLRSLTTDGFGSFMNQWGDFWDRETEKGGAKTTVMADVVVYCLESFHVQDLTNGESIQGDGKERVVPHVIKMEIEYADIGESRFKKVGDWKVADVDELVSEGKLFFVRYDED